MKPNKRNILFIGIIIAMILTSAYGVEAVFSDIGQLSPSSARTRDSFNFSPNDLFQKLKDFISIEIFIFNPKDMINNDIFAGFNDNIRDITGVDIIKFFSFITGLFYKAFLWLTQLLQSIKSRA